VSCTLTTLAGASWETNLRRRNLKGRSRSVVLFLLVAPGRLCHTATNDGTHADDLPETDVPGAVEAMCYLPKTHEGKAIYERRKSTVEINFGILTEVQGFCQSLLRRFDTVA